MATRLEARSVILVALSVAAYIVIEVQSYLRTYPDRASRAHLQSFDTPAIRMLQGRPYAVDTVGGFVAWDGGWVLEMIIAIWAILTMTRMLRGEEESGRSELVLAGSISGSRSTGLVVSTVMAAVAVVGLAAIVALTLSGASLAGSLLFGAGLTGFAATLAGLAAVSSQLFGVRRRAAGTAALLLGLFYLLRVVSNSADGREWVGWSTPFGWMDRLHAFGDNRWTALIPFAVAALGLAVTAVALRRRRDDGAGVLPESDRRPARLHLLGSSLGFAWRSTQGAWLSWTLGLAVYCFVLGTLVNTVIDFLRHDPGYRKTLEAMGWDAATTAQGFLGTMGVTMGVAFALYACWRVGAARTEEATKRIDLVLARPLSRWRWLGEHVFLTGLASVLLVSISGFALWAGAAVTGAPVSLPDTLASTLNTLPVVAVYAGLAVLTLAALPRATVALTVTVVMVSYLANLLGPTLSWPTWVVDLSPFSHVAFVPVEPFEGTAAVVMVLVGSALALAGMALFRWRDLAEA